ncbi:hypothetical protein [Sphingomonas sp.]|uniref:hypothetical protein n=1 Tax=Sphingomonas sp. TaxID=28214 RepID=UPI003CC512EF
MILPFLLLVQAGTAQAAAHDVTVTARRPDHDRAVQHMTATIAPLGDASQPLPRFAAPICPEAAGLPPAIAVRFAGRMRQGARAAGLRVDEVGCAPNITVVFVPNGQSVVRALKRSNPAMFGGLEPYQVRRLAADSGPVHAWSFTEVMSRDDDRPRVGTSTGLQAPELQVRSASILSSPIRIVVDGAVLLIDQGAAEGKTITQLADYATMRLLASARPVGDAASEPTILRLFDRAGTPAAGLTPFDTTYLRALYRGEPTDFATTRISTMARQINRDLARAVAGTPAP